jgi:class 3 adenylate cyclase
VTLAARLSGKAATGQILISQRSYAAIEGTVEAEEVSGLELKGISHPVTAWNVLGLRRAGDAGAPDEVAMRRAAG